MRVCRQSSRCFTSFIARFAITILMITAAAGQGSYQAQVRGTVTDQSGAIGLSNPIESGDAVNTAEERAGKLKLRISYVFSSA